MSGCFVSVVSEDGESRRVFHAVYMPFSFWSRGSSSHRHAVDPGSKTRGLKEFRSWVRLALTGPSDKGGG